MRHLQLRNRDKCVLAQLISPLLIQPGNPAHVMVQQHEEWGFLLQSNLSVNFLKGISKDVSPRGFTMKIMSQ